MYVLPETTQPNLGALDQEISAAKPKHSPLPEHVLANNSGDTSELVAWLDRELKAREHARQLFIEGTGYEPPDFGFTGMMKDIRAILTQAPHNVTEDQ